MVVSLCHTGGLVNWEVVDQLSPIYVDCNPWKNCKFALLKFSRSSCDNSQFSCDTNFFLKCRVLRKCSISGSITLATGQILNICKHVCKDCKITMYCNAECFNCPCRDLSFNKLNGTIPPSFAGMRGVDYM